MLVDKTVDLISDLQCSCFLSLDTFVYPCSQVTNTPACLPRAAQRVNQLESRAMKAQRVNTEQHMQQTAQRDRSLLLTRCSHRGSDVWAFIIFEGGNWAEFRKMSLAV